MTEVVGLASLESLASWIWIGSSWVALLVESLSRSHAVESELASVGWEAVRMAVAW